MVKKASSLASADLLTQGVSTFFARLNLNQAISTSDLIQDKEDMEKAREIVKFILRGSYLPDSVMYDNHRSFLKIYRNGFSLTEMSEHLNMHMASIGRMCSKIEYYLDAIFPLPLQDLIKQRRFDTILLTINTSNSKNLYEELEFKKGYLSHALTAEKSGVWKTARVNKVLNTLTDEELYDYQTTLEKYVELIELYSNFMSNRDNLARMLALESSLEKQLYVPKELLGILDDFLNNSSEDVIEYDSNELY